MTRFSNGAIFWSSSTGAHVIYGATRAEYQTTATETDFFGVNVQKEIGLPTSDETGLAGGGRVTSFEHGKIYWSSPTGAHAVYGAVNTFYNSLGGPHGFLGLPTVDEGLFNDTPIPSPTIETYQSFEGGTIYWIPQDGGPFVLPGAM